MNADLFVFGFYLKGVKHLAHILGVFGIARNHELGEGDTLLGEQFFDFGGGFVVLGVGDEGRLDNIGEPKGQGNGVEIITDLFELFLGGHLLPSFFRDDGNAPQDFFTRNFGKASFHGAGKLFRRTAPTLEGADDMVLNR